MKIQIQPRGSHKSKSGSVSITSDVLEFELDEKAIAEDVAAAAAEAVQAGIRSIAARTRDGKRQLFNRTGHLSAGIAAAPDGSVVAPPGYLEDPALVDRLVGLVPALADPLAAEKVQTAIDEIEIVKVK